MAMYRNLKGYRFSEGEDDIRGSDVYGSNGEKLGEISDVIFDPNSAELKYVVIDTGGWLSSNKFLVPARQVMESEDSTDFRVALTKEQIERFPAYDEKHLESEDRWRDYESRYDKALGDGPVLHREGSTHTITPQPEEMPISGGSNVRPSGEPFRGIAHDMPRFGATSSNESSTGHTSGLFSEEGDRQTSIGSGPTGRRTGRTFEHDTNEHVTDEPLRSESSRSGIRREREERIAEGTSERVVSDEERPDELTPRLRQDREARLGRSGSLPSEYSSPEMNRGPGPVARMDPEGGRRFREFQERLRRDRENILRKRERDAA